ncbi:MAG: caspase family protein, partial [Bacteroidota bacterium]
MPDDEKTKAIASVSNKGKDAFSMGKNYLLAIGINDYAAHSKLKNAVKDVQDIAALLASRYAFQPEAPFSRFLLDGQATEKAIKKSLRELCATLQPDDRALIFYSGHGHLDPVTKLGYWIPADAEKDESDYLSNSIVRDFIKAMPCRHVLLISDSCFSGELLVRDASRQADGAFADWERKKSRWVFCSGKEVVSDGKAGENSPFAAEILRCLREQSEARQPLEIVRLANEVTRIVRHNFEQQAEALPLFGVGDKGGQFIFYPQKNEDAAFEKAKASRRREDLIEFLETSENPIQQEEILQILSEVEHEEAWQEVSKYSYADLFKFVQKHPGSPFAPEARQQMAALKAKSDAARSQDLERQKRAAEAERLRREAEKQKEEEERERQRRRS